ncbi:TetR/AcrR family transcriptional regulator [Streptomyces sp. HNM0663]|uniref:TetR/AcrR family transcriptional regulator n=1 Tax=Streptomyces chengmaiensis TaxID=3040919 RepID=A0ABT6HK87_9ACTN|nr:TetR/AcrR family transcriptional regulator [Streptomyces chengmaiensis]MDH2389046.1 TetR/AcrR family transcriptional regulator [Streptomyces chengmaiensis]
MGAVKSAAAGSAGGASGDRECARRAPRPRADALRNRERIVAAAREMFVEHGPDVPLDEIARRAGVGNATLYRHFPDRAVLIRDVVVAVLDRVSRQAEAAMAEEADPFAAVRRFVHTAAEERIGALCPMLSGAFDTAHPDLDDGRERLEGAVQSLVERAQSAGRMRGDVAVGDLMVALSQLARPLPGTVCPNMDRFVHRHLQLFVDGLEAPARSELPGVPATLGDLRSTS